jgi:hypothetical protein
MKNVVGRWVYEIFENKIRPIILRIGNDHDNLNLNNLYYATESTPYIMFTMPFKNAKLIDSKGLFEILIDILRGKDIDLNDIVADRIKKIIYGTAIVYFYIAYQQFLIYQNPIGGVIFSGLGITHLAIGYAVISEYKSNKS